MYDELAALVKSMPRIPRRELRCHPLVVDYLRNCTRTGTYTFYDELSMLYILVYVNPDMEPGAWELYENGVLVKSGNTEPRLPDV